MAITFSSTWQTPQGLQVVDYGSDVSTFLAGDLDPSFGMITGQYCVAEALARRIITPRGSLLGAPNYGFDIRRWVNGKIRVSDLYVIQSAIASEWLQDERVYDATCQVEFTPSTGILKISGTVTTSLGPFSLVLSVSSVSVQTLSVTTT